MSIETRVSPFSRSFRTLTGNHADLSKTIKDLKALRAFCVSATIDIQVLKDLKRTRDVFFRNANAGEGQALALR